MRSVLIALAIILLATVLFTIGAWAWWLVK